jgi:hypothetical protein
MSLSNPSRCSNLTRGPSETVPLTRGDLSGRKRESFRARRSGDRAQPSGFRLGPRVDLFERETSTKIRRRVEVRKTSRNESGRECILPAGSVNSTVPRFRIGSINSECNTHRKLAHDSQGESPLATSNQTLECPGVDRCREVAARHESRAPVFEECCTRGAETAGTKLPYPPVNSTGREDILSALFVWPDFPGVFDVVCHRLNSRFRARQLGVRGEPDRFVSDPEFRSSKLARSRPETAPRVSRRRSVARRG